MLTFTSSLASAASGLRLIILCHSPLSCPGCFIFHSCGRCPAELFTTPRAIDETCLMSPPKHTYRHGFCPGVILIRSLKFAKTPISCFTRPRTVFHQIVATIAGKSSLIRLVIKAVLSWWQSTRHRRGEGRLLNNELVIELPSLVRNPSGFLKNFDLIVFQVPK